MPSKSEKVLKERINRFRNLAEKKPELFVKKVLGITKMSGLTELILSMRLKELKLLNNLLDFKPGEKIKISPNFKEGKIEKILIQREIQLEKEGEDFIFRNPAENRLQKIIDDCFAGDKELYEKTIFD